MNTRTILQSFLLGGIVFISGSCTPLRDPDIEKQLLLDTDRAFAEETALRGADGWAEFFASDGVMFPPSGRVDGREAIRKAMEPSFGAGKPMLVWEPTYADVAASFDVGYTLGRWKSVGRNTAGSDSVLATGNYVTIWKKDPTFGWRVAVDIGNKDAVH